MQDLAYILLALFDAPCFSIWRLTQFVLMLKNVEQIKLLLPSPFIQDCIYSEITFIKSAISRTDVHHFQKISIRCHNNVRKYTSEWCKIIIITGLIIYFFLQLDGNIPTIVYIIYLYFEFRLNVYQCPEYGPTMIFTVRVIWFGKGLSFQMDATGFFFVFSVDNFCENYVKYHQ